MPAYDLNDKSLDDINRELKKLKLIAGHVAELSPAGKLWLRDTLTAELENGAS